MKRVVVMVCVTVAAVFLEDHGYVSVAKEGEIEAFALSIVEEKLDTEAIAFWLKQHTKKSVVHHRKLAKGEEK